MPMTLLPQATRDAVIRELVATTRYVDPTTGEQYEPADPPVVVDPQGNEDAV